MPSPECFLKAGDLMKKTIWIAILSIACVLSLGVMILILAGKPQPEFTPPPFEPEARSGVPEVPDGLGYKTLDAGAFQVMLCGEIRMEEGAADIWFTNPAQNQVWLKLRILDAQGKILGQTGLLRPGEYVRQVKLETAPDSATALILKVMAYEPETYLSAGSLMLNTGAE